MEDLKARYYAIARQLVVAREGGEEASSYLTLIKHPYNADHERCALFAGPHLVRVWRSVPPKHK